MADAGDAFDLILEALTLEDSEDGSPGLLSYPILLEGLKGLSKNNKIRLRHLLATTFGAMPQTASAETQVAAIPAYITLLTLQSEVGISLDAKECDKFFTDCGRLIELLRQEMLTMEKYMEEATIVLEGYKQALGLGE